MVLRRLASATLVHLIAAATTSELGERWSCADSAAEAVTSEAALLQAATLRSKRVDAPDDVSSAAAPSIAAISGIDLPMPTLAPMARGKPHSSVAKPPHAKKADNASASLVQHGRQGQQPVQPRVQPPVQPPVQKPVQVTPLVQTPAMQAEAAQRMSIDRPAVAAATVPPPEHQLGLTGTSASTQIVALAQQTREQFPMSMVYIFPSTQTDAGAIFTLAIISVLLWCTLVWSAACFYRHRKRCPQAISSRPEQDFNDWSSGPLDVFQDCSVCCWACWCPCIRWADNMDMMGFVSFWVALLIFCGVILLNTVPGGILLWLVASLLWMSYRQQLRKNFDMPHSNFSTFAGDWALYCCCWPFAIAQEARHIEEAARAAHKAVKKSETV